MIDTLRRPFLSLAAIALLALAAGQVKAQSNFETPAAQAVLIDYETGAVLYRKAADEVMFPASMTKIMTVLLAFDRLHDGSLTLQSKLPVSEKAWRMGGSKMFVKVGDDVTMEDLLRGIIVQSGNDASVVVAEGLGGSEASFAEIMTRRAREIGMNNTVFRNATGWPDPEHVTTAHDMALLAAYVIRTYPEYYSYYAEKEFTYGLSLEGKPITQYNRNPLLFQNTGADGLKTGHTEASGYGLTASAVRDGRRLVMVINGLGSETARKEESRRLLEYGFREFDNYRLFSAGETVDTADVWLGSEASVPLVMDADMVVTLPRAGRRNMAVKVVYQGPIPAPIAKGQELATLEVTGPGFEPISHPLYAATDIGQLAVFGRVTAALRHIIFGASGG